MSGVALKPEALLDGTRETYLPVVQTYQNEPVIPISLCRLSVYYGTRRVRKIAKSEH